MNYLLEAALKYEAMGFSIIPIKPGEKAPPLVAWEQYQKIRPTSEEIKAWWDKTPNANVGIVTGKLSNLAVIDIDKYADDFDEATSLEYFPDNLIAPTVLTPRGGNHLYFTYPDHEITINARALPGIDLRGNGGYAIAPPSVNGNGKPYIWVDELNIEQISPPPPLPLLYLLKIAYNKNDIQNIYAHGAVDGRLQMSTMSTNVYNEGRRDQDLFHAAHLLVKAGCEKEFLCKTLEILALNCKPPFPLNEAEIKIKSAIDRANRKERNLMAETREDCLSTNGVFLSTEQAKRLQLSTREDLKNHSICLKRLWKNEHIIEKYGNKNGVWRTVDQEEELIDYEIVDKIPYAVTLPLGVHEYVTIHKGNIIVIAGESNSGKTAFSLNVALKNCNDFNVNYMSSEMQNGTELRIRMDKFNVPLSFWKSIKFQFRTDNFPDKIDPEGLNIIDYLDEGSESEAYKMPGRLRNIADKLRSGIALVSIQKDPHKDYGFGGAGTLNRARLYMNITTDNILTIKKGKMWRNEGINPNGMFCKFALVAGCKFKREGDWRK